MAKRLHGVWAEEGHIVLGMRISAANHSDS